MLFKGHFPVSFFFFFSVIFDEPVSTFSFCTNSITCMNLTHQLWIEDVHIVGWSSENLQSYEQIIEYNIKDHRYHLPVKHFQREKERCVRCTVALGREPAVAIAYFGIIKKK